MGASVFLSGIAWPSRSTWRILYGKEERRQPPREDHTPTMRSHKALRTISQGMARVGCPSVPLLNSLCSILFYSSHPLRQQQLELTENLRSDAPGGPYWFFVPTKNPQSTTTLLQYGPYIRAWKPWVPLPTGESLYTTVRCVVNHPEICVREGLSARCTCIEFLHTGRWSYCTDDLLHQ